MLKCIGLALAVLFINLTMLFVAVKPVYAPTCGGEHHAEDSYALLLEHGKPIMFNFAPGQKAILAGDVGGKLGLQANSVVSVTVSHSGKGVGYSMETLPPQDFTPLLQPGENEIRLVAVDTSDTAYLVINTPSDGCDSQAQATSTPVPVPAPTPPISNSGIIASTATVSHMPENGPSVSSVDESRPEYEQIGRLELAFSKSQFRVLIGIVLLTLLLSISLGDIPALRRRLGWK